MSAQPILADQPEDGFDLLPPERHEIAIMSRAAQKAVLAPEDPGIWSVEWRHAVAARICREHAQTALADGYLSRAGSDAAIADPAAGGRDPREKEVLGFMDLAATSPKDITAEDIASLTEAGVSEADIVRLCELAAFLAYQCRVAAGLSLMNEVR